MLLECRCFQNRSTREAISRSPTDTYWRTSHCLLFILQRECDIRVQVCQAPSKHSWAKPLLCYGNTYNDIPKVAAIQMNMTDKQQSSKIAQIRWPTLAHTAFSLCHGPPLPPGPSSVLCHKTALPRFPSMSSLPSSEMQLLWTSSSVWTVCILSMF